MDEVSVLSVGLKFLTLQDFLSYLPRMNNLLKDELNREIIEQKLCEDALWVEIADRLFSMLEPVPNQTSYGCLTIDRLQYFLLALLLNEIREDKW